MLRVERVSKSFGSVLALDSVSVDFAPREIHAVLGENGAGKSTLMKILYGLLRPDGGSLQLDGRPLALRRPADAQAAGIGMVHQHFMLVERLTVAENVMLGDRRGGIWLPRIAMRRRVSDDARRLALEVDPARRIESLSVGERQRVEILKALRNRATTLILDEPTAVLTPQECEQLFVALRRIRDQGCRVLFISHKLHEVTVLADRVSVLRHGRLVASDPAGRLTTSELSERMIGRVLAEPHRRNSTQPGPVVLKLNYRARTIGHSRLRSAHLEVRAGEIVGVAGVEGNGQDELTRELLKAAPCAHIASDRQREALVLPMSITDNASLKDHQQRPYSRLGWLNRAALRRRANEFVTRFDIRTDSVQRPVAALSGGNQQKLVVARELANRPDRVVAVNPTRGLDMAASRFVHEQLISERDRGAGIVLISADLDEILQLSDRVFVLYDGTLTAAPRDPDAPASASHDAAVIGRLMTGLSIDGGAAA